MCPIFIDSGPIMDIPRVSLRQQVSAVYSLAAALALILSFVAHAGFVLRASFICDMPMPPRCAGVPTDSVCFEPEQI